MTEDDVRRIVQEELRKPHLRFTLHTDGGVRCDVIPLPPPVVKHVLGWHGFGAKRVGFRRRLRD